MFEEDVFPEDVFFFFFTFPDLPSGSSPGCLKATEQGFSVSLEEHREMVSVTSTPAGKKKKTHTERRAKASRL